MKDSVLTSVLIWVEENLITGKNINELVSSTGYSRRTLEFWFRERFGMTPGEYLFRRRMSRISVILRMTSISITEIAELFHYSSSQNFSRAFQRFTGVAPSKYRKSAEWDCSHLQISLLQKDIIDEKPEECYLHDRYIKGSVFYCESELFSPTSKKTDEIIKAEAASKKDSHPDGIYIAARTINSNEIITEFQYKIKVCIVSGHLTPEPGECSVILPKGKYLRYRYKGSWLDYSSISYMLYFKIMSSGKYKRRDEFDCIHFHPSHSVDSEYVSCDIFIPIV